MEWESGATGMRPCFVACPAMEEVRVWFFGAKGYAKG